MFSFFKKRKIELRYFIERDGFLWNEDHFSELGNAKEKAAKYAAAMGEPYIIYQAILKIDPKKKALAEMEVTDLTKAPEVGISVN